MCWYESELQKDSYVQAATIFSVLTNWTDFALDQAQCMELAKALVKVEPPPPPPPDRARGIDVSYWQCEDKPPIDWQVVADSDVDFAIIRASVGDTIDKYWEVNYQGARAAGLLVGAYHYLNLEGGQAGTFAKAVAGKVLELGCWADIELDLLTADKCANFFRYADPQIEQDINIYSSASKFNKYGTPAWAAGRLLWVADWRDVDAPLLPDAWKEWEFWQHTSDGAVPGIVGRVDLDVFRGTPELLYSVYGNGEEEPVGDIKIFGYIEGEDGPQEEKTWDWLVKEFGPLEISLAESAKMPDGTEQVVRLIEVREQYGPANCNVELFHIDGSPVGGINAAWHYSTAPLLPATQPPTSRWEDRADYGPTNVEGVVGFSLSDGSYYQPDLGEIGPYACWFLCIEHPSDFIRGLGMDWNTNHRHLNLKFQIVITSDEPPPPPPPPPPPVGSYQITGTFGGIPVDLVITPVE